MTKIDKQIKQQEGFSLVEALVSMAILVSVLLPVVMFLGYLGHTPHNEQKIQALNIAQTEMETTLHGKQYTNQLKQLKRDSSWIVSRQIFYEPRLVAIEVKVFRHDTTDAIIELRTERLYYEEDQ